jgi:hypothetical protein
MTIEIGWMGDGSEGTACGDLQGRSRLTNLATLHQWRGGAGRALAVIGPVDARSDMRVLCSVLHFVRKQQESQAILPDAKKLVFRFTSYGQDLPFNWSVMIRYG